MIARPWGDIFILLFYLEGINNHKIILRKYVNVEESDSLTPDIQ
jgi:hypothetical protein